MSFTIISVRARFNVVDSRGRELGANAWAHREGERLRVVVHASRNGENFGAHPGSTYVDSEAKARTLITKKVDAMRKRVVVAAKKTGGVYLTAGEKKGTPFTVSAAQTTATPDAECVECREPYFSGEGHKTQPLCAACK